MAKKTFTLKDVVTGQERAKVSNFNTDLFVNDREALEQFEPNAYAGHYLVSADHQHDKGENDKLVETVVAIGQENEFYLITATSTQFNGELQVSFTQQEITLKGFNFFTKDYDADFTEVYNDYLAQKGYEFTTEDIISLGELNTDYNVTTLRFKDDEENMHYLTVNSKGQLSSVTVKQSAREVKTKQTGIKSAFGQA